MSVKAVIESSVQVIAEVQRFREGQASYMSYIVWVNTVQIDITCNSRPHWAGAWPKRGELWVKVRPKPGA